MIVNTLPSKKALLLLSVLILNFTLYSQSNYREYHHLIVKSQKVIKDSAIVYLEKAIKIATPFPEEFKNLSLYYFQIGNEKKAKEMFLKAIVNGYQFETDEGFNSLYFNEVYDLSFFNLNDNSKYGVFLRTVFKDNLKDLRKLRKKYLEQINPSDDIVFESLLHNEKYFQELRFLFFDNKVKDSLAFNYIGKYGATPNSYYMLELLKKGAFPKRRKCTRFNGQTISMLLNHAVAGFLNEEDALEFVRLLWPLVEIGELTPNEYASAYDHYVHHFVDENKSLFGTKMYMDGDKLKLMELISPNDVNRIREEHWIIDIELFCKNFNIKLPKNYE